MNWRSFFICAPWALTLFLSGSVSLGVANLSHADSSLSLRQDIQTHTGQNFSSLIERWKSRVNRRDTLAGLFKLAQDRGFTDHSRYIALQGFTQLSSAQWSQSEITKVSELSRDPSWMVRTGALKALEKKATPEATQVALHLLKDSALVVRMEALRSIESLKAQGQAIEISLLEAAEDPRNWKDNQPLMIPERATQLVMQLRKKPVPPKMELKRLISQLKKEFTQANHPD